MRRSGCCRVRRMAPCHRMQLGRSTWRIYFTEAHNATERRTFITLKMTHVRRIGSENELLLFNHMKSV